jgi:hypothetical protein
MPVSTETIYLSIDNNGRKNPSTGDTTPPVARCVYCGEVAKNEDDGDRRSYDWSHYCECEGAKKEQELKKNVGELKNKLYYSERDLRDYLEKNTKGQEIRNLIFIDQVAISGRENNIDYHSFAEDLKRLVKKHNMEQKLGK